MGGARNAQDHPHQTKQQFPSPAQSSFSACYCSETDVAEIAVLPSIQVKSGEALILWFAQNPFGPRIRASTSLSTSADQSISL
jgi:hypothetical protein